MKEGERGPFFPKLCVRIKDNNSSPHGKFYRFLFPFSSKFSDLNFASYVLYIYLHTVSLGYLCCNKERTDEKKKHAFKITILLIRSTCFSCMLIYSPQNLNLCSDSRGTRFLWNVFETVRKTPCTCFIWSKNTRRSRVDKTLLLVF